MSQLIGQGGTITLDAFYRDGTGAAVDPTSPLVSIIDAVGTTVIANAVPTRIGTGHYEYAYTLDIAAPLGAWDADWTGLINGSPVEAHDGFTVVAAGTLNFDGTINFTGPVGQVRLLIADTDDTAFVFTDAQIGAFLTMCASNVRLAAAQALDAIAVNQALILKVMTTLDTTTDGASLARALREQATELRRQVAEGPDGGGDFDIAEIVVDGHTFRERLLGEFERSSTSGGIFDPEFGVW